VPRPLSKPRITGVYGMYLIVSGDTAAVFSLYMQNSEKRLIQQATRAREFSVHARF